MQKFTLIHRYCISCIYKPERFDPKAPILFVGANFSQTGSWIEKPATVARMIAAGTHTFYVLVDGREVEVVAKQPHGLGEPYLQTVEDRYGRSHLLNLCDFPDHCDYASLPKRLPAQILASARGLGVQARR